jgi:uncharacterized membrane-anchored protein
METIVVETTGFRPRQHPDRALIDAETHARPVTPLSTSLRIRRAAFMADPARRHFDELRAEIAQRFCAKTAADARQLTFAAGGYQVTAEFHNEFATLTWTAALDNWIAWPEEIGLDLFAEMPLIAATRIDLVSSDAISPEALAGFNPDSLSYSEIFGGTAQAATDFVIGEDGFTRFEVAASRCGDLRRGVIVRRLLEIETYRNLALLGLPLARALTPHIHSHEQQLAALMRELGHGTSMADNRAALDALHHLSMEVGRTVEDTNFRFAASHAYSSVLRARLERLGEVPIGELTTFERYLENRIEPAIATLTAIEKRLAALTAKLERSTELLNARISLSIETQNQTVLDTIADTARSQYRLQHTVERLSTIAIAYYALALLGYVVEGLHEALPLDKNIILAIAAPIILLLVWFGLRSQRNGHK